MDEFVPQTGGLEVREGHEESDLSVNGIFTFLIFLAIGGVLTFFAARVLLTDWKFISLHYWENIMFGPPPPLTAAQQQLQAEREVPAAAGAAQRPEWYGRGEMEEHLGRTFPTPRLQYDDVYDMDSFRNSENAWLENTGKTAAGNIHIPIDQAKDLVVEQGLPKATEPFEPPTLPTAVPMVPATAAQRSR